MGHREEGSHLQQAPTCSPSITLLNNDPEYGGENINHALFQVKLYDTKKPEALKSALITSSHLQN